MNLDTGQTERLSDDVLHGAGTATKTPDSALIAYMTTDFKVKLLDAGKVTTLYEGVPGFEVASVPSIASNRRYVAFCRNEITDEQVALPGRELCRVQRPVLHDQRWARYGCLYGWLRLV